MPAVEEFATTAGWTEIAVDATQLGVPLDAITGLTWASTKPGSFAFAIDQITLEVIRRRRKKPGRGGRVAFGAAPARVRIASADG